MAHTDIYVRSSKMRIVNMTPDEARDVVKAYMSGPGTRDERRMRWMLEAAAEAYAMRIDRIETSLVSETFHQRQEEVKELKTELERVSEDFKFLYAVNRLMVETSAKRFGEEIKRMFKK